MLRERLKELDLKITELADYLQISRPTMYKFIEYYDNSEFDLINKNVLKLFNYINEHPLIGKRNVVNFILNNLNNLKELGSDEENEVIKKFKKFIISNPEAEKSKFITLCVTKDSFDDIMSYLNKIQPLLRKRKLTIEEENLLKPYKEFKLKIGGIK